MGFYENEYLETEFYGNLYIFNHVTSLICYVLRHSVGPGGRAVEGVGLRPLA